MKRTAKRLRLAALGLPVGLERWASGSQWTFPARAFASSVGAMAALGGALYNIPSPLRAAFAAG